MQNPQAYRRDTDFPVSVDEKPGTRQGLLRVETGDPAEFEVALRPWELLCRPRRAGRFSHCVTMFTNEDLLLYRERFDLGVELAGMSPPGMILLAVPVCSLETTSYWGESASLASLPYGRSAPIDARLGTGYEQLVAGIRLEALPESLSPRVRERLEQFSRSHKVPCTEVSRQMLGRWIASSLERMTTRPELTTSKAFQSALSDAFVSLLIRFAEQKPEDPESPPDTMARRGFQRALEFIHHAPLRDVRLSRLCAVADVSERSLQYAFREHLGMTPKQFLIRRRLHAVRQALLAAEPGEARVSDIATRHGFFELGRFAGQYSGLFGERPSETLRRVS